MNKKLKKTIVWILSNMAFCIVLYFGYIKGVQGAENIVNFWVIILSVVTLIVALPTETRKKASKDINPNDKYIPVWLDTIYDICIVSFFVYFSAFIFATFYFLHVIAVAMIREESKKN